MNKAIVDQLIVRMESYLECWKQFNTFMTMARNKKFSPEDESQFLEIKSVLAQELELILANIDCGPITREDVHILMSSAPSIRYLSEINEGNLRNLENQWHKLFIGWQSILGQLKVRQGTMEGRTLASWFKRKVA